MQERYSCTGDSGAHDDYCYDDEDNNAALRLHQARERKEGRVPYGGERNSGGSLTWSREDDNEDNVHNDRLQQVVQQGACGLPHHHLFHTCKNDRCPRTQTRPGSGRCAGLSLARG